MFEIEVVFDMDVRLYCHVDTRRDVVYIVALSPLGRVQVMRQTSVAEDSR